MGVSMIIQNLPINIGRDADGNDIVATYATKEELLSAHPTIAISDDTTSSASPNHGGTFECIDSIERDRYGHIVKINIKTVTLPTDNNTDTKVTQSYSTSNNSYPLLMSSSAGVSSTSSRGDKTAIVNNTIYANPSTGVIHADIDFPVTEAEIDAIFS